MKRQAHPILLNNFCHKARSASQELSCAAAVYRPSPFWKELSEQGLRLIEQSGIENFKRSVNMRYFNWNVLGIVAHQLLPMLVNWARSPEFAIFEARVESPDTTIDGLYRMGKVKAKLYAVYVALLWEYCKRCDSRKILTKLEEPTVGNPFIVQYKGIATSQDLCNSVHEFYQSTQVSNFNTDTPLHVAELGAGYGRLAYVFLQTLPNCNYTIIDIPPALILAEDYLRKVFPDTRIFPYRAFKDFNDVAEEFHSSRVRFLLASQIELLPNKSTDLFLNISSLHEMTMEQIKHYFLQINRLCRGTFYTKQWRISRSTANGFRIGEKEYPVGSNWSTIFHRRHPIQRMFFEALYKIPTEL